MASKFTMEEELVRPNDTAREIPQANGYPHMVAILPRGEVIRNFIYTGVLDEVARHLDVTLLSVLPNDELVSSWSKRYTRVLPLQDIRDRWVVGALRDLLDMAHGRWLWSEAAKERWRLRDREATTPALWLKRLGKKAACYPFAHRKGLRVLSEVEALSSRLLRSNQEYIQLFKRLRPSLVFNGSHIHGRIAVPAVEAAKSLGIPTATFVFSWDNLTSQGRLIPQYDNYLVWSDSIRNQLLNIYEGIRPDQVFVTGTPQFDQHFQPESYWTREEFCERIGADPSRPMILYSTGMPNHMPGEPTIVGRIAEMLREMTDLGLPQLIVRVYPKDQTGRFEELKQRSPDILFPEIPWEPKWLTPKPEDGPLLTNTLRHVVAGINVASTISLELCMFNKPVINVGYNPPEVKPEQVDYRRYYKFDHYRPLVDSGAVAVAGSEDEMRKMIRQSLSMPELGGFRRRALLKTMFGQMLDGQSGARVAAQLMSLSRSSNRG